MDGLCAAKLSFTRGEFLHTVEDGVKPTLNTVPPASPAIPGEALVRQSAPSAARPRSDSSAPCTSCSSRAIPPALLLGCAQQPD